MSDDIALLRRLYDAYAARDIGAIDEILADDVVMHVAGTHPLSGDKCGKAAAWEYLGAVSAIAQGEGGFELLGVAADGAGHVVALTTGTVRDFVRPVVHLWTVKGDRVVEFWDAGFDQAAEDAFWISAVGQP